MRQPSEIQPHGGVVVFPNAFGKAELEYAALCLWTVCRDRGAWGPVRAEEMRKKIQNDPQLRALFGNPFARVDFFGLVDKGLAVQHKDRSIELTPQAIERLYEVAPARTR